MAAKKEEPLQLDQAKALAGVLGLLVAEREERLNDKKDPRKTEVILADAGLAIGDIAKLMGKKYDAVKQAVRRVGADGEAAVVEPGSADELSRILALTLKYQVPQAVLVHDLSKQGLSPRRIAELLGTSPNTVSQAKRQKHPKWPK